MSVSQEVQELLDKQAIRELVFTYSRAVDRKDFALLRTLYTDDGYDDHGGLYRGSASGYVDWLEQAMQAVEITTHSAHNHLIAFSSPTEAEGELYVTAYHRLGDPGGYNELVEGLRYLDQYSKRNGVWQFKRRTIINEWAQVGPAFWDIENPALKGTPIGQANADDPSYRHLAHPLFRRR